MTTVLQQGNPTARKVHQCNYCRMRIEVGEKYTKLNCLSDGSVYTWKMHTHCGQVSHKLINFEEMDEGGATASDFINAVFEKWSDLHGQIPKNLSLREALQDVRKELGV